MREQGKWRLSVVITMQHVELSDGLFQGHVSLQRGKGWVRPWRLPVDAIGLYPPDALRSSACQPAGVRITLDSDTTTVRLRVCPSGAGVPLDCVVDNDLVASA